MFLEFKFQSKLTKFNLSCKEIMKCDLLSKTLIIESLIAEWHLTELFLTHHVTDKETEVPRD